MRSFFLLVCLLISPCFSVAEIKNTPPSQNQPHSQPHSSSANLASETQADSSSETSGKNNKYGTVIDTETIADIQQKKELLRKVVSTKPKPVTYISNSTQAFLGGLALLLLLRRIRYFGSTK